MPLPAETLPKGAAVVRFELEVASGSVGAALYSAADSSKIVEEQVVPASKGVRRCR